MDGWVASIVNSLQMSLFLKASFPTSIQHIGQTNIQPNVISDMSFYFMFFI